VQTTRRRHTHTMEGLKMCHMGRHGDGYDGTILPSCDISDVGCSSRSGGGQEDSECIKIPLLCVVLFSCIYNNIIVTHSHESFALKELIVYRRFYISEKLISFRQFDSYFETRKLLLT